MKFVSYLKISLLLSSILLLFSPLADASRLVIEFHAPPLREKILPPPDYVECVSVPADYATGTWVESHRICRYENRPNYQWVSGHWEYMKARHRHGHGHAVCKRWVWVKSHWEPRPYAVATMSPPPPVVMVPPPPSVVMMPAAPVMTPPPPTTAALPPPPVHGHPF